MAGTPSDRLSRHILSNHHKQALTRIFLWVNESQTEEKEGEKKKEIDIATKIIAYM